MISKIFQKFLIFAFFAAFLVILVAGILRIRRMNIESRVVPQKDKNALPEKAETPKKSAIEKSKQLTTAYTGDLYRIPWGDLSVVVTIDSSSGKITDMETPDFPDSPPSIYARPYLIDQAIKVGNADIQGVSGATYTSLAFKKSLESALSQVAK